MGEKFMEVYKTQHNYEDFEEMGLVMPSIVLKKAKFEQ
jgi:hypothetical protein